MADFEEHAAELAERRVLLVAASVDDTDDARRTVERHGLSYPVAYGLDARRLAAATGAFYDAERGFLQATGFVLAPDGTVAGAVYSTGPVGRYRAADVVAMIDYLAKKGG